MWRGDGTNDSDCERLDVDNERAGVDGDDDGVDEATPYTVAALRPFLACWASFVAFLFRVLVR